MSKKRLTWHVSVGIRNPRINIDKFIATSQLLQKSEKEINARFEHPELRGSYIYILDKDYDIIVLDAKKIAKGKNDDEYLPIFLFVEGITIAIFRAERSRKFDEIVAEERKKAAEELKAKRELQEEPFDDREPNKKTGE